MREWSSVNITVLWQPLYDYTECFPHTSACTMSSRVWARGQSDGGGLLRVLFPAEDTSQSPESMMRLNSTPDWSLSVTCCSARGVQWHILRCPMWASTFVQ